MHELGVLTHAIKTVEKIAEENGIKQIDFITLDVGRESFFVPDYLVKLYPVAIDSFSRFEKSTLKINIVEGNGLVIKEIGY